MRRQCRPRNDRLPDKTSLNENACHGPKTPLVVPTYNEPFCYTALVKILFTRFPLESRLGGAERQTVSLMQGLIAKGHAVAFAGSCPVLLGLCKEHGIPAVEWQIGPPPVTKWGAVSFLWQKKTMQQRLRALLTQFRNLDAICMLSFSEKLLLTNDAVGAGAKVMWIEHDRIGRWLTKNPWLPLFKKQSDLAHVVTVSEMSKKLYEAIGINSARIHPIPNGIDLTAFTPATTERTPGPILHVGCVARLSDDKGVDVLLRAAAKLPAIKLSIVGTGPKHKELLQLAHKLGVFERTAFVPSVDSVADFYRSCDMFVLPSTQHDPFGMVAAEAMACGTPVIVTDACGIAGYLEDKKNSLIIRAGNSDALQQGITRLCADSSLRASIATEGRSTAEKLFSVETMVERYEALLRA